MSLLTGTENQKYASGYGECPPTLQFSQYCKYREWKNISSSHYSLLTES